MAFTILGSRRERKREAWDDPAISAGVRTHDLLTCCVNTVNMPAMYEQDEPMAAGAEVDTKTRILDAAEAIIREKGLQALSLRAIAAHTGLTAPAAYRHFSGKEEILQAVIQRGFLKFQEGLARAREGMSAPDALLRTSMSYYLDYWARDPVSFFLMMEVNRELGHLSSDAIEGGSFGDLLDLVARYQRQVRGGVSGGEAEVAAARAAHFLAASLQGVAMGLIAETRAGGARDQKIVPLIESAVEFLCGALAAFFARGKGEHS